MKVFYDGLPDEINWKETIKQNADLITIWIASIIGILAIIIPFAIILAR